MSLLDQIKGWVGKGKQAAQQHQPQVNDAIDKAGKVVDDKTGGKHTDKIGKAQDAAKKALGDK
ncbi:MAG TPA: antitoxin [Aldersonia sp.]